MSRQFDEFPQVYTPVPALPEAPLPLSNYCLPAKVITTLTSNTIDSFCLFFPLSDVNSHRKMVWD